jgi:type I restriction enzyme M protein
MAKRHQASEHLISQVRRCQELIMARTGVDEFYETVRLLLAKSFWEKARETEPLTYENAQLVLQAGEEVVKRFVEGEHLLCAPEEVANECLRILSPTLLKDASYDMLHTVFEQMTGRQYKSEKGQYFTPSHVVDFCIDVLRPRRGETLCDPACGSGAFLKSAYESMKPGRARCDIYGFDISKRASKTASLLSYLACDDRLSVNQLDALAVESSSLLKVDGFSVEQFMRSNGRKFEGFDIIATNPPFAGDVSEAQYLNYYQTARLGGAKIERDTLFLERCHTLLKPGGRLAIVLPDNKFSGARFAAVRRWLLENMLVKAVVSLHSYTFRPFTSQKACILFAVRDDRGARSEAISFYRSDKAGKSSNGDPVLADGEIDHDLTEIANDITEEWVIG